MAKVMLSFSCGCGFKTSSKSKAIGHADSKKHVLDILGRVIPSKEQGRERRFLREALKELYYARHNIKDCPAKHSKDEINNVGELEHADDHILNAKSFILKALKE